MARTKTTLDTRTFSEQGATLGPYTIDRATRSLGVGIDRTGWTARSQEISVSVDLSMDGGKSWEFWCGFTCRGGREVNPDTGETAPDSYVMPFIPPPVGALIRAHVKTNGGDVLRSLTMIADHDESVVGA